MPSTASEAAIQYYLNHREGIEQDMRRGTDIFAADAPRQEPVSS
jgi:hypothetical protein